MAGRLSEDAVVQSLDTGWQSLVWKVNSSNDNSQLSVNVSFNAILDAKDPVAAAQAIPRRDMYLALVTKGPEDALDILPLLSPEQFTTIIDNEAWVNGQLSIHNAIRWLDLYKHIDQEQFYKRFRELDEEYQVGLLNPYIDMKDEDEFEKLPQEVQDKYRPMPCITLWWCVKNDDEKIQEFVSSIIESSISEDAAYLYSLLGMAAMLPPNEQEALMKQFRDARLEEDGFVTFEESLALFTTYSASTGEALYSKWKATTPLTSENLIGDNRTSDLFLDLVLKSAASSGHFDDQAIDNIHRGFAYVGNAASAACQVTSDDIHGLIALLQQIRHTVSFGLEVLSDGNLAKAEEILFTEYPKSIFQFALVTVDMIRLEAISKIKLLKPDSATKLEKYWRAGKFGACLWMIDTELLEAIGFENAEILKGLFNRFPMVKDEVISTDKIKRVKFRPLTTTTEYSELFNDIKNLMNAPQGVTLQ